jgi:uncharacterized repeat protein (TIGR01451 family)
MKIYPLFVCLLFPCFLCGQIIPYQIDFLDIRPDTVGRKILELAPISTQIYWALGDDVNYLSNGSVDQTFSFRGGLSLRDGIVELGNIGDVYYYHYLSDSRRYYFMIDARLPIPRTLDLPLLEDKHWSHAQPVMAADKLYAVRERAVGTDTRIVQLIETELSTSESTIVVADTVTVRDYPATGSMASDGGPLVYFTRPQDGGVGPAVYDATAGTVVNLGKLPATDTISYERIEDRVLLRYRDMDIPWHVEAHLVDENGVGNTVGGNPLPDQSILLDNYLMTVDTNGLLTAYNLTSEQQESLIDLGTRAPAAPLLFGISGTDLSFYQRKADGSWIIGRTDGTSAGTREAVTITQIATGGPAQTVRLGHYLAFTSNDNPIYLYDPRNDDLQEVVADISNVDPTPPLAAVSDRLYFAARAEGRGEQLHYLTIDEQRTLSGTAYEDANGNGVQDTDETGLSNLLIAIAGEGSTEYFYTDEDGDYAVAVWDGATYTVTPYRPDCYSRTTAAESYTVEVPTDPYTNLDFGYTLQEDAADLALYLSAGRVRCNTEAPFWITVRNEGCLPLAGTAKIALPANVEFVTVYRDSVTVSDTTLTFTFDTLQPGASYHNAIKVKLPNEDFAGEQIELIGSTSASHRGETAQTDTVRFSTELRCAIDPNDKQVFPYRFDSTESNYTRAEETIRYRIRFENMGNDTAFAVRIEDQLSEHLDWNTLEPLRASHPYEISLSDTGLLTVNFPGIELVDTSVDAVASQGFIAFEIKPKADLPDFTRIENKAGIYFDFNRPVITNTVVSTIVEELDADEDGTYFWNDCNDTNSKVYPGTREIVNNGLDDNCDGIIEKTTGTTNPLSGELDVFPNPVRNQLQLRYSAGTPLQARLISMTGRHIRSVVFRGTHLMDLSTQPAGVYLLRVVNERTGGSEQRRIVVGGR